MTAEKSQPPPPPPPEEDKTAEIPPLRVFRVFYEEVSENSVKGIATTIIAGHLVSFPHPRELVVYEFVDGPPKSGVIFQKFRRAIHNWTDVREEVYVPGPSIAQ